MRGAISPGDSARPVAICRARREGGKEEGRKQASKSRDVERWSRGDGEVVAWCPGLVAAGGVGCEPVATKGLFGSLPISRPAGARLDLFGCCFCLLNQAIQCLRIWASLAPRKRRGQPFLWGLAWARLDGAPAEVLGGSH